MRFQTSLTRRLGLEHPILQAPMAGGPTTVDRVAAVSEAGGLGSFGAAYNTPEQILEHSAQLRRRTKRPFGINLFAPLPQPPTSDPAPMVRAISAYHEELGLPPPKPPAWSGDPFEEQLAAVLESGAALFSVTFGTLPPSAISALKERGILVVGTATTVEEAQTLERRGVEAVVAQGSEAGGHRGTFAGPFESAMVGTMALVPQVVDAVEVPVIASGGVMDGRGVAAAMALGAQAVQMGTAFLTCDEAGAAAEHKEAILTAREDTTRVTRAFSGRPARGIVNRFVAEIEEAGTHSEPLPFPLQNALTRELRKAAGRQGNAEFLSLWAGQGVRMSRRMSARELVELISRELEETVRNLADGSSPAVDEALTSPAVDQ